MRRLPSVVPPPRYGAAVSYDLRRHRTLMFGGIQGYQTDRGFVLADNRVWEWSGGDWRALPTLDTPSPRGTAAMAQHLDTGDIWMFGGGNETESLDELIRFDGTRWTQVARSEPWPPPRAGAALGFDPVSHKMVLFGGMTHFVINERGNPSLGAALTDTWTWDGTHWELIAATGSPPARPIVPVRNETLPLFGLSRLLIDETRQALVLVGEALEGVQVRRWDAASAAWILEATPAPAPNFRLFTNMFWDYAGAALHLAGGVATNVPLGATPPDLLVGDLSNYFNGKMANDEWALAGNAWVHWRAPGDPGSRAQSAAAFHLGLGRGVLFGGAFGSLTTLGDTWTWDGGRWAEGATLDGGLVGVSPPARTDHALAYDPERVVAGGRGAVVMFGGADGEHTPLDDTWVWRDGWTRLQPTRRPSPRLAHVLATVPGGVLLYGGYAGGEPIRETWFLGSNANEWTQLPTAAFAGHSMCAASAHDSVFIYGGVGTNSGDAANVFQRFGPDRTWQAIPLPPDYPERRLQCALTADPAHDQLILTGGDGAGELKENFYRWSHATSMWRTLVLQPYDTLGEGPGRLLRPAHFYDPVGRGPIYYGGVRKDLDIQVGRTWRVRQLGDACASGCADGLHCVDGVCCEASACGPCESCAMPGRRGVCSARGVVESTPGCSAEQGVACSTEGRCRSQEGAQCNADAQCASASCLAGVCCGITGCAQSCLDEHTQKNADGTNTSCGDYMCQGSACRTDCNTIADCSGEAICSPERRCVPPDSAAGGEPGGCSCRVPAGGASSGAGGWSLLALLALAVRRRRP